MEKTTKRRKIALVPDLKSEQTMAFESGLQKLIVGQERALRAVVHLYQVFQAGLSSPGRPMGNLMFLGPTGSGKTRIIEAAAEVFFGAPDAFIKIDCAEFQHSHEIAKLVGSPPGYLGHKETAPVLTQENLEKRQTKAYPFSLVLFDEIEKASDTLWQLLLGILDKATLTLGDNRRVDFSKTMIFMTSNLGSKEMTQLVTGNIGFAPAGATSIEDSTVDQKLYRLGMEAARRRFSPEFMNRIDKVVVFRRLQREQLRQIIDLELSAFQRRLLDRKENQFVITVTDAAKEFLLSEGTDDRYGARHLKRAIERFIVNPIASIISTNQVSTGDVVAIDFDKRANGLSFCRDEEAMVALAPANVAQAA